MDAYKRLELEWAEYNGVDPAGMVVCATGTAALHLALEAFQLPPGSEVLTPDFTMVACPRAVVLAGLHPVFVDVDPKTLLMDWRVIEDHGWGEVDPAAIMPVHIYGRRFNVEQLRQRYPNSFIVEDLAEAHGVKPSAECDAACWSFYRNKIIHGAEGGAVWFDDPKHATLARQQRSQGFTDAHDFMHVPRGHNYRLSDVHAELISMSLLNSHNEIYARRRWEGVYNFHCPDAWKMPPRDAPWVYDVRIPGLDFDRQSAIINLLNDRGIPARMAFKPMSVQLEFRENPHCLFRNGSTRSNAYGAAMEMLYFPLTGVTQETVTTCFDVCRLVTGTAQPASERPNAAPL